jgi:hypothetical protein
MNMPFFIARVFFSRQTDRLQAGRCIGRMMSVTAFPSLGGRSGSTRSVDAVTLILGRGGAGGVCLYPK